MATNIKQVNLNGVLYQNGNGVPIHISDKGAVFVDLDSGLSYINKDGLSQWATILDSVSFTGGTSGGTSSSGGTSITAFTYDNANTFTISDSTGGTFSASFNTVTGLTVNGSFSAITVSATTFYGDGSNLTGISTQDTFVTGGTYSAGTAVFTNNTGGTFSVSGFSTSTATAFTGGTVTGATNFTGGVTANTISATTYYNLPIDVYVTGGTYSNGTAVFRNNTGNTFNVTGFTDYYSTGGTVSNGILNISGNNVVASFNVVGNILQSVSGNSNITATTFSNGSQTLGVNWGTGSTQANSLTVPLSTANTANFSGTTVSSALNQLSTDKVNGSGVLNQVTYWSGSKTITGSTAFTWVNSATTLTINGTLEATNKSFVISHPTKDGMKLVYGSLEGPENGVYHRGRLINQNTIVLPDYWSKLVDDKTITVDLTPIGFFQKLYVKTIYDDNIVIGIENGLFENNKIDCFFIVYGERKDINKLIIER